MNLPIKNSLGKFHGSAALVDYKWFSFSVLKIWSHLVVVANKTMFPSISSRITARLWNTQDTSVILWSSLVLFIPNQTQRKRALHIIYMYIYIFHLVFSSLSIWIQILFYFWHHLLCFQRSRFTNCFSNLSIALHLNCFQFQRYWSTNCFSNDRLLNVFVLVFASKFS